MKKIITAIGDKYLNERLKEQNFEVLGKDIQYIEGVFEKLELQKDVNVIIISSKLIKENKYKEFIYKINLTNKNIKLIFILESINNKLIKYLKNKNIKYYYKIKNERNLKHLIKYLHITNIKLNKTLKKEKYIKKHKSNCRIITVTGINGVGKTVFTTFFSKINKDKILIIDLDKERNSLHIFYNVNKKYVKTNKINNYIKQNTIIRINKNTDLLINVNLKNNKETINNILNKYKKKYNYIVIDVGTYIKHYLLRNILNKSNTIIFLTEGNLLQIKKSKSLLDLYLNNWKIQKENFRIILNKKNKNTIHNQIIKNSLYNISILGEIQYNVNFDNLINNRFKNLMLYPKIIKKYKKIIDKI